MGNLYVNILEICDGCIIYQDMVLVFSSKLVRRKGSVKRWRVLRFNEVEGMLMGFWVE